jgi:hypothetical protein
MGCLMCGARPWPLRVGPAWGPATTPGDRACPGLGAWRGQDDAGSRGGRPCDGGSPRPEGDRHGMPRTPPARPGPSPTSPRTSSARPPTRSRPHVQRRRKARARPRDDSSASASATGSRRRSVSSCLMTRGCATTSAGRCSTVESDSAAPAVGVRLRSVAVRIRRRQSTRRPAFVQEGLGCVWPCGRSGGRRAEGGG